MPSDVGADYLLALVVWAVSLSVLLARAWGARPGVGLALAYLLNLALIHLFSGILPLLPWYWSSYRADTLRGFPLTGYAVAALLVGHTLYRLRTPPVGARRAARLTRAKPPRQVAIICILVGLPCFFILGAFFRDIPSTTAVFSNGLFLATAGCCLLWWAAYQAGRRRKAWLWASLFPAFPVLTVLFLGFLGFGIAALLSGASFIAGRYRPRWLVLIGGVMLVFLGLSFYTVYMSVRTSIRASVWGGAALSDRIGTTTSALQEKWSWFDCQNNEQLGAIDGRLNQNLLLGRADQNLKEGRVRLVEGETLKEAVAALVPRILWPGKPNYAGSGDLVTRFTGIPFAAGTSVGIGHVMELYINFGVVGLVIGFAVIGFCLAFLDAQAGRWLMDANVERFLLFYVPGQALMIVGGTFAEIPPCAVGGVLLCLVVTRLIHPAPSDAMSQGRQAGER